MSNLRELAKMIDNEDAFGDRVRVIEQCTKEITVFMAKLGKKHDINNVEAGILLANLTSLFVEKALPPDLDIAHYFLNSIAADTTEIFDERIAENTYTKSVQ